MGWTRARGRVALRRSLVSAGLVVAVVGGFAHAAWAWTPVLSGETTCSDSDHLVTWSIGNSVSDSPMTIASASASVGNMQYAVTGYGAVVPGGGSTSATTTVPGGVTGTVVLTVQGTWTNGEAVTSSTHVVLEENCTTTSTASSTTTSTESSTTTSVEVSPTSVVNTSTTIPESTTVVTQGATVATTSTTQVSSVTVAGVTATTAAPNRLPLTGSGGGWPPLVGATALGLGGALSLVSRRRRGSRA